MMRPHQPPRGLSREEQDAWARLANTVTPMQGRALPPAKPQAPPPSEASMLQKPMLQKPMLQKKAKAAPTLRPVAHIPANRPAEKPRPTLGQSGLDSHWERRIDRGGAEPDFTLDLHGHSLDAAHARLDHGLVQAKACGARMVLIITGKPRPVDAADRGHRRGAIRAKILDWLAAGPHEGDISAIRNAHRRHGGTGALYVVLRRRRQGLAG